MRPRTILPEDAMRGVGELRGALRTESTSAIWDTTRNLDHDASQSVSSNSIQQQIRETVSPEAVNTL